MSETPIWWEAKKRKWNSFEVDLVLQFRFINKTVETLWILWSCSPRASTRTPVKFSRGLKRILNEMQFPLFLSIYVRDAAAEPQEEGGENV
jgi:hypothetical protein